MNKGKDQPKIKDIELTRTEIEEKISSSQSEIKIRKYKRGKLLGRGGFARCYEFTCLDNNKVFAAKVINKQNLATSRQKQKLITEIKIHKSVHHDQVVAFEHNFEDNENVYILLEVCNNQTLNELFKRRKKLTEIEVQCYIIQLVKGLQYLHSHKIIHRDLKLGNLFLTDKMQLKIGDFGLATKLDYDGEKKKTVCGTPNYIAPEVIDGGAGGGHSYEVDIWAIGIIIYIFIVGKPPFETNDLKQTYKRIKSIQFDFPEDAHISTAAKNLIRRLLVKDPKKRPSLNDILMDDFFNMGALIPKLMPSASMACPPSLDYIRKFMPNADENGICHLHDKKDKNLEENNASEEKKEENPTGESSNTNDENKKNDENDNKEKEREKEQEKLKGAEIYVNKWVDYSTKYGLGYLLNNGNVGVYIKDYTKILLKPISNDFIYVEKKMKDQKDMIISFKLKGEPKEIKKNVNFPKF
jgi:polo-like kinase 1